MKHSRVKLFVKADYLTSKADISHIIFSLVKSWLAFGSRKSFFNHWIYIYNCFCWYIIQIVEDSCYLSSEVKHATSCNEILKKYRIIFGQGMIQFTKYKIQNSTHLSKRDLSDVMSPIVSALCCSQKERNCLESGFWYFTQ